MPSWKRRSIYKPPILGFKLLVPGGVAFFYHFFWETHSFLKPPVAFLRPQTNEKTTDN